jgi:hypothetical protein
MSVLRASVVCLLLPGVAWADEVENCAGLGRVAQVIMALRQNETPLSEVMALTDTKFLREMVLLAYDQPLLLDMEDKRGAVRMYGEMFELSCYKTGWGKE